MVEQEYEVEATFNSSFTFPIKGTTSEEARDEFMKNGYNQLCEAIREYWNDVIDVTVQEYPLEE